MTRDQAAQMIENRFQECGHQEWWHNSNKNKFLFLLDHAVSLGVSPQEALFILTEAFDATANEYGD